MIIILHYQVIQDPIFFCNNTIREEKIIIKTQEQTRFAQRTKSNKGGIQTWVAKITKHTKGVKSIGKNENNTVTQEVINIHLNIILIKLIKRPLTMNKKIFIKRKRAI